MNSCSYLVLLLVSRATCQEVSTPSSLLRPRNFNHHPFDAEQFLKSLQQPEPTKEGPVLFPNDAPPPPRPPLIVTSRPLEESIARSELGATPSSLGENNVTPQNHQSSQSQDNTVTSQSQHNRVSFVPFLARVKDYRPFIPSPTFDYHFVTTQVPYADVVEKTRLNTLERDNRFNDYEKQTVLPPIYKALADHAKQKVLKVQQKQTNHYQAQHPDANYARYYQNNDINEEHNPETDQNQNYAFSYTVKDQKTGDDFSHSQHSSGSATNGEYRVRLPDGRMQIVSYTADENGYNADVRYDDEDKTAGNSISDHDYNHIGHNARQHNIVANPLNDYTHKRQHNSFGTQTEPNKYGVIHQQNNYAAQNQRNNYALQNQHNNFAAKNQHNNYVDQNHHANYAAQNDYTVDYTDRGNKNDYVNVITNKKDPKAITENVERDYYTYPDVSKEYYNDYSSEYNNNYEPHRSKFSTYVDNKNVELTNKATASTVKPSYDELKDLFVTKSLYNTQQNYDPVELNVPSTTPTYDGTTEHVVLIGNRTPNLYTNIRNGILNGTPVPVYSTPKVIVATTPRSYLASTIASLKNKVRLATKPVLSQEFINKINKYISFK